MEKDRNMSDYILKNELLLVMSIRYELIVHILFRFSRLCDNILTIHSWFNLKTIRKLFLFIFSS